MDTTTDAASKERRCLRQQRCRQRATRSPYRCFGPAPSQPVRRDPAENREQLRSSRAADAHWQAARARPAEFPTLQSEPAPDLAGRGTRNPVLHPSTRSPGAGPLWFPDAVRRVCYHLTERCYSWPDLSLCSGAYLRRWQPKHPHTTILSERRPAISTATAAASNGGLPHGKAGGHHSGFIRRLFVLEQNSTSWGRRNRADEDIRSWVAS